MRATGLFSMKYLNRWAWHNNWRCIVRVRLSVREEALMRKLFVVIAAAALALSIAATTDAAEAKKVKPRIITGTVEAVDVAAGTLSVKGKIETVSLKAGEKVKLEDIKIGDKVTATYTEGVASKVVAARKAAPKKDAAEGKGAASPSPAGR